MAGIVAVFSFVRVTVIIESVFTSQLVACMATERLGWHQLAPA